MTQSRAGKQQVMGLRVNGCAVCTTTDVFGKLYQRLTTAATPGWRPGWARGWTGQEALSVVYEGKGASCGYSTSALWAHLRGTENVTLCSVISLL